MKIKQIACIGILLAAQTATSYGAPGEGVVLDANGDYIITYAGLTGKLLHSKFVPATKIEPTVSSSFKFADVATITYRYTISNGSNAKQPITTIRVGGLTKIFSSQPVTPLSSGMSPLAAISAVQSLSAPITKPSLWDGHVSPDPKNNFSTQVSWHFFTEDHPNEARVGIPLGDKQQGFGFASLDLPGVGKIRMEGDTPIQQGYEDMDGPQGEVLKQVLQLEQNDFVTRRAAVPAIAVPTPFDAALLLERIQTHVHTWIGMKLLDPAFSAQLDTSFKAAIDAYRSNQPKAGKSAIKTLRELLKKAYPDLDNEDIVDEDTGNNKPVLSKAEGGAQFKNGMIARLPARVLDFDLKYVLKQLGEE